MSLQAIRNGLLAAAVMWGIIISACVLLLGGCAQHGRYVTYDIYGGEVTQEEAEYGVTSTGSTYHRGNPAFLLGPGRAENVYEGGPTSDGGIRIGNQIHYSDGRPMEQLY